MLKHIMIFLILLSKLCLAEQPVRFEAHDGGVDSFTGADIRFNRNVIQAAGLLQIE